jgi:nucleotide-binding universal stress UspA family protein
VLGVVRDGDHLVLGSRGRGGVRSGLFGSTVNGVLGVAAVPVAVVREAPSDVANAASRDGLVGVE